MTVPEILAPTAPDTAALEDSAASPVQPATLQMGPERALLRRLADSLGEVLTPLVPCPGPVGAYRAATAPAPMLLLLDYVDELERQLTKASHSTGP